ncbi:glycoside hydrolase family 31 protein [Chitinophaga sancti]|uniref:glycoside hydrolase family 31 protein n=1 Tax=Chitinophaga sancti TaxID=1004 RepID=UPI002A747CE8|nr:TIM-barrel domain-containing protein [Chitinophaga sancti]WPQ65547.1 glycoside hydrolase family 31 protein [Chitinophaga sancti]
MNMNYRLISGFLLLLSLSARSQNPVANPASQVTIGSARFTILTPSLIRMEWNEKAAFEDKASLVFINRNLPVTPFQKKDAGEFLEIKTTQLTLRYKKNAGKFSKDNLKITFTLNGRKVDWVPGLKDSLNLKGTTRTLDQTDGDAKLEDGLLSKSGWTLIDDSNQLLFDGDKDWNWATTRKEGDKQDWYFFGYGHEYKKALYDYTRVAGKIPMPPKYAFGYWWSRYWTYSDTELRGLLNDFTTYNIPIDVLIIDMDWHYTWGLNKDWKRDMMGEPTGWTGYTWNKNLFPEPEEFLTWAHHRGVKTALNLHPASGIAPMEAQYNSFAKAYDFDTTGKKNIPFKIEDKKWAQIYFDSVLHPIEKQGIDFWWLDWQQWLENRNLIGLSNTWWLNYTFFTDKQREGGRPLLFHRWGGLGNHRYQIGFSGDSRSTWASLAYQPYFTATASNVGYGYWSHDIGGHVADNPDPELYLRWIQFGTFSPIFRTHCSKSAFNERRIWKFPEHYKMMLKAYELRYALNPYIYTASHEAFDSGVSICRPMYYDYPESPEAYTAKEQYLFGDDMIVAPITAKADSITHLAGKKVWLPAGQWFDYFSGGLTTGNKFVENKYTLDQVPVFIKAGSIIPMYGNIKNLQKQSDTLILTVIPGGSGATKLYEDDGNSEEYKDKGYSFTAIRNVVAADGAMVLTISPREGSYKGMPAGRSYEIKYPSIFPPASISVNGQPATYTYSADRLMATISIPATSCAEQIQVKVIPNAAGKGKEDLLYKAALILSRLSQSTEDMKYETARIDWVANTSDCILALSAIPGMINYHPEQTVALVEQLNNEILPCIQTMKAYPGVDANTLRKITAPLEAAGK